MIQKLLPFLIVGFLICPVLVINTISQPKLDEEPNLSFSHLIAKINQSKIKQYHAQLMSFGSRYTGSQNCRRAGDWIYSEFSSMDLQVRFHDWQYAGFSSRNIVATLPGTQQNSSVEYLLTAHYDCTPNSLGANDDGSGIAAILSIANVLQQTSFPYTIRFIAFSGEEVGTYGSYSYTREAYENQDNIRAVINPDMIGYADTVDGGKRLRFFYPKRSKWIATFAQKIVNKYDTMIDMKIDALPNYVGSDHQPFVDYGYDGVWVAHQDGYQWANTPEDTPEHLNFTYLTKATKTLLVVIAELAIDSVPVSIQLIEPLQGYFYVKNNPLFRLDFGEQWYLGLRGKTIMLGSPKAKAFVEHTDPIKYVIFCVDNNFLFWDSNPPYEWNIQGKHVPIIGKHTIQAYAYTTTGHVAMDEMDIIGFSTQYQYG
ncbi:MAG: Zn-dependent exopeptidase M28 [Candidatus Thermoplasmatota archaeon]|nr:Zn-dependent exopeptidase M28 [Candidatus Thermoplasmatota archaeon]